MRPVIALVIIGYLLSGCAQHENMNSKAYVITQSQFEEAESEAPTSELQQ